MDVKAKNPRLTHDWGLGWVLSFYVEPEAVGIAKKVIDDLHDDTLRVSIREWKDRRGLSANAYFHVLVNKIAVATGISEDEVKRDLVLNYGAQARDKDGNPLWVNLPKGIEPESLGIKYAKWFNVTTVRGEPHDCYIIFQETHRYDTKEFSRLLDGAIHEAKTLGIVTATPAERERMMFEYAQADQSARDRAGCETESV